MIELQFWKDYKKLESEFIQITQTIPLVKEHLLCPWSPKFRDLMSELYGSFEDVFSAMIGYYELKDRRREIKKKEEKILYYCEFLDPVYKLSSKEVMVKDEGIDRLVPFSNFAKGVSPDWWKVMQKVRHKWSENREKANLKNTLEALAGLFVLNVVNKPSRINLVDHGIWKCDDKVSVPVGHWNRVFTSLSNGYTGWKFSAETPLFLFKKPLEVELKEFFGL